MSGLLLTHSHQQEATGATPSAKQKKTFDYIKKTGTGTILYARISLTPRPTRPAHSVPRIKSVYYLTHPPTTVIDYCPCPHFPFSKYGFFAGVILDGPAEIHDKNRRYSNGDGSYTEVLRGIEILRNYGVFNGAICGVSNINQTSPKKLLNFFISNKIKKLKFAWLKTMGDCGDMSAISIPFSQYIDFMIAMFDAWLEVNDPEIEIRDIQSVINLLLGGTMRECIYMGRCDEFVTIYPNGAIYGCDTFPKTPVLYFGSVKEGPLVVRSKARLKSFQELAKKRKEACRKCGWHYVCKGGCAKDHYASLESHQPLKEHCTELIRYFEHVSTKLKKYDI